MSLNYIEDNVDIYLYPPKDKVHVATAHAELTIGDLHANAVKLLYALVRHQYIEVNESDYNHFVNLYTQESGHLDANAILTFDEIIHRIAILPRAQGALVRFLGDILADRGSNDYFVLKLLKKLNQNQIKIEIILSNHDAEFIYNHENNMPFSQSRFVSGQSISGEHLQMLIDKQIVTRQEISHIFNENYKPNLKLISYVLLHDSLVLFSHAAITLENIKYLAKKLNIDYVESLDNNANIIKLIDEINDVFQDYVVENEISRLIEEDALVNSFHSNIRAEQYPFFYLIWNRAPVKHFESLKITWVHGHDMTDSTQAKTGRYNLDNYLGKGMHLNTGIYNVLFLS